MRARRLGAGAAAFAVAPAACAPLPITRAAPRDRPIEVACCGLPGPPVEFVYLGVGGWLVRRGGSAILFAPLFSNPSLTRAGFSGIAPDTVRIERALDSLAVDLSEVSLILSGHGHYDHLMDVPYVMTRHAPGARLLANRTSAHQIASWGLADRITVVDDSAGDRQSAGRWIRFGDVRVMPFRSRHAPHFDGYVLFEGTRHEDLREPPPTAPDRSRLARRTDRQLSGGLPGRRAGGVPDVLSGCGGGRAVRARDGLAAPGPGRRRKGGGPRGARALHLRRGPLAPGSGSSTTCGRAMCCWDTGRTCSGRPGRRPSRSS